MSHGDFEFGRASAGPEPAGGNPAAQDQEDAPRVRFVGGPAPAVNGGFKDPGATASERAYGGSEIDQALKPVNTPPPQPTHVTSGVKVATDRAPTPGEVLDPPQPRMAGASQRVLVDSVTQIVDTIYKVLNRTLDATQKRLAQVSPPPETPLALEIIGAVVEGIAVATVGFVGKLAVDAVKGELGDAAGPVLDGIKGIGKDAGAASNHGAVSALGEPIAADSAGTLLDEFCERERTQLDLKEHDIDDMLRLLRGSAARNLPQDLAALDTTLRAIAGDPALPAWFEHKLTMEWMNFCARLSLGPRAPGQDTDMPGANQVGGVHAAGERGRRAWAGGPERGAVDITVAVSFGPDGSAPELQFVGACSHMGPGAGAILRTTGGLRDEHGVPYTLATLPVYRSVWLKTGDSRLDTWLAFVITPEGAIEANFDDGTLAAIGAGRQGDDVPKADSMIGAHQIASLLRGVGTEQVR